MVNGDVRVSIQSNQETAYVGLPNKPRKTIPSGINLAFHEDRQKKFRTKGKKKVVRDSFKENIYYAMRIAFGCVIASVVQTRSDPKDAKSKWAFFPATYYLGNLNYAVSMVIFSAGRNLGQGIKNGWQGFAGVGIALAYNMIFLRVIPATQKDMGTISLNFISSSPYEVSYYDVLRYIPLTMVFTAVMLSTTASINTRKFAVQSNVFFALKHIDPNSPIGKGRKDLNDELYSVHNVLKNYGLYYIVGFMGSLIAIAIMIFPTIKLAIWQFRATVHKTEILVAKTLDACIDSYCFLHKSPHDIEFTEQRLRTLMAKLAKKIKTMEDLLQDVWWEHLMGMHVFYNFNLEAAQQHKDLLRRLVENLNIMVQANLEEQYDDIHEHIMKKLRQRIYVLHNQASKLLREVKSEMAVPKPELELKGVLDVDLSLNSLLLTQQVNLQKFLVSGTITPEELEKQIPLNLFLFGITSFCENLISIKDEFTLQQLGWCQRFRKFLAGTIMGFISKENYSLMELRAGIKTSVAVTVGLFVSVFFLQFNDSAPSLIAMVMGAHIGGTFKSAANRVLGIIAGNIIPSIIHIPLCWICDVFIKNIAVNVVLFIWVTISAYFFYDGGSIASAGLVSAFVAAGILSNHCTCTISSTDSNSLMNSESLVHTSIGICIFIFVEFMIWPNSASKILRHNLGEFFDEARKSFMLLFKTQNDGITQEAIERHEEIAEIIHGRFLSLKNVQRTLLSDCQEEPILWRRKVSDEIYSNILLINGEIYHSIQLLFSVESWFVKQKSTKNMEETRILQYLTSARSLSSAVENRFLTLRDLVEEPLILTSKKDTALYLQMKAAFRSADIDGSGFLDADEVAQLLRIIFCKYAVLKDDEIEFLVQKFMELADTSGDGKIGFDEFMEAIEQGLSVEIDSNAAKRGSYLEHDEAMFDIERLRAANQINQEQPGSPEWKRNENLLDLQAVKLLDLTNGMVRSYCQWVIDNKNYDRASIYNILAINCFLAGLRALAKNLTDLERIVTAT